MASCGSLALEPCACGQVRPSCPKLRESSWIRIKPCVPCTDRQILTTGPPVRCILDAWHLVVLIAGETGFCQGHLIPRVSKQHICQSTLSIYKPTNPDPIQHPTTSLYLAFILQKVIFLCFVILTARFRQLETVRQLLYPKAQRIFKLASHKPAYAAFAPPFHQKQTNKQKNTHNKGCGRHTQSPLFLLPSDWPSSVFPGNPARHSQFHL